MTFSSQQGLEECREGKASAAEAIGTVEAVEEAKSSELIPESNGKVLFIDTGVGIAKTSEDEVDAPRRSRKLKWSGADLNWEGETPDRNSSAEEKSSREKKKSSDP